MKVKFKTKEITEALIIKFNNPFLAKQGFSLDIGEEYLVFGLYIEKNGAIVIDCLNKNNHLHNYPLDLFEVVDNRVSKYWKMKIRENGEITFLPNEYYENEYFHDDLSEDTPEIVEQFHDMIKRFQEEFN
ncbi:hypothetical protein [Lacihabitans lacunae]|uniref:Uncharacterized protein n=1 Tax=Lacihabitans lacunae TaxID=1028214 RepID=A0ABV7Z504_9BACT